ncbi:zinc-ribbon domain-containing protein [Candidatus Woesearchaeota archaeon]|nr:zinc-ribbon domain-containing protein [Candidatus Woesearchaeota archaeon]
MPKQNMKIVCMNCGADLDLSATRCPKCRSKVDF